MTKKPPTIFSLLTKLTAEERQKFGEERRKRKARDGVREELVDNGKGSWSLVYYAGRKKLDELMI
jgi:hypothetical protein